MLKSPVFHPISAFLDRLQLGHKLKQSLVVEIMDYHLDRWQWKQATDYIEAAICSYLLTAPQLTLNELRSIQDLVPDHTVRSLEQMALQQFSTPLELAWLVAKAAGMTATDILLEPSAGTGILPSMAINYSGSQPSQIYLNEFSKFRRELLPQLFPNAHLSAHNAEFISDYLPRAIPPTLIIMNPPFSRSVTSSKRHPDVCLKHLRSALLKLAPAGRLVAIVAHWLTPHKYPDYFASLPARLIASIFLDGSYYRHHGTTMDTRMLVFDKDRETTANPITINEKQSIDTIGELLDAQLPQRLSLLPAETPPVTLDLFADTPLFQLLRAAPSSEWGQLSLLEPPPRSQPIPPVKRSQKEAHPLFETGKHTQSPPHWERLIPVLYRVAANSSTTFSDGIYQPYQPSAIEIPNAAPHPTPLAESVAMAAITAPYPTVEVKLPAAVIEEGLASREQLETLIYAMNAHDRYLDTRWCISENKSIAFGNDDTPGEYHRQGFFIGHGTGCGKGLICALIILANWCEGRKKAIWLSKNETLIEDARRDWQRLGGKPTQIVPLSKYKLGEPIGLNEGILFVTYGGLRTPGKNGKKSRLEQILDWVGADFQGSISLDESHLLGNCAGEENERGRTNASAQGLAGTHLIDRLPHARVTYLSATGAAKVSSLAYCQRLGLWMTQKFPFKSREEFLNQLGNAGVAALEILAQDLKRLGLYTACTLSFDGVKFETLTHHLTTEQRKIWDIYAQAFQIIHTNINAAFTATNINSNGKCLNARAKSVALSAFEGMKQRFFNQLLCAAKAPTLIDAIEGDLAAERSCVIQLVSTNEAILDLQLAQIPSNQWGDLRAMDFSSKNVVCDYLYHAFPIHLYLSYIDEEGTTRSALAQDELGEPIVSQEALAIRDRLLEDIALLPPMTGLLDQLIWHFGHDNIAEVTGRSKRVIYRDNRYQLATRSTNANIAETHSFQSGSKRILIFSNAGGTGRSYHADLGCINQQLRRHYLVEAGWEAISAVQGFGRSHRSNQQQPPEVVLLTTDVKGELRFTATIASRLSSLGAISKGQSSTGNNGLFQEELNDFSSKYAKYALAELFSDLHGGMLDLSIYRFEEITGLNLTTESGGLLEDLPSINRFMNRLLALLIEQQNYLFTEFATRMQERIDRAKANGTYERGMETLYSPLGFEIADTKILSDSTTCYSIDKLSPPRILTPAETREMVLEGYRYCRHRKDSTQVAIAKTDDIRINRKGEVVDTVQIRYPVGSKAAERLDLTQFESKWEFVEPDAAFWQSWQTAIGKAPKLIKERFYLICGLLLPHWRKFPAFNPKVYRLKTNDGRVLLGRAIEPADIAGVLTNFGIDTAEIIDAEAILATVLAGNRSHHIGSKYHLCRTYFKGGEKLEIVDIYDRGTIQWLTSIGCFVEMVDWKMRVFITRDRAVEIIDILLADAR